MEITFCEFVPSFSAMVARYDWDGFSLSSVNIHWNEIFRTWVRVSIDWQVRDAWNRLASLRRSGSGIRDTIGGSEGFIGCLVLV
jgi:hypothetical protein